MSSAMLNFFNTAGLIEEVSSIMISNLVITSIYPIILDIDYYMNWYSRKGLEKFMKTGEGEPYTQGEANAMYRRTDFWIMDQYAYIFCTLATALFYLPIFPMAMVYAAVSLLIHYFVSKVSTLCKLIIEISNNYIIYTILSWI